MRVHLEKSRFPQSANTSSKKKKFLSNKNTLGKAQMSHITNRKKSPGPAPGIIECTRASLGSRRPKDTIVRKLTATRSFQNTKTLLVLEAGLPYTPTDIFPNRQDKTTRTRRCAVPACVPNHARGVGLGARREQARTGTYFNTQD